MRIEAGKGGECSAAERAGPGAGREGRASATPERGIAGPQDHVERSEGRSETWWVLQRARSMGTHSPASAQIPLSAESEQGRYATPSGDRGAVASGLLSAAAEGDARQAVDRDAGARGRSAAAGEGDAEQAVAARASGPAQSPTPLRRAEAAREAGAEVVEGAQEGVQVSSVGRRGADALPEGFLHDWIEVARRNRGRIEPGMGVPALTRNLGLAMRDGGFSVSSRHAQGLAALDATLTGPRALSTSELRELLREQADQDPRLSGLPDAHREALAEAMARFAESQRPMAALRRFAPEVSDAHRAALAAHPPRATGLRGAELEEALSALREWRAAEHDRIAETGVRPRDPLRRLREQEVDQVADFHESALRNGWRGALPEGPLRERYEGHLRAAPGDVAGAWQSVRRPMIERMQARVRHAISPQPLLEGLHNGIRGQAPDAPGLPWGGGER